MHTRPNQQWKWDDRMYSSTITGWLFSRSSVHYSTRSLPMCGWRYKEFLISVSQCEGIDKLKMFPQRLSGQRLHLHLTYSLNHVMFQLWCYHSIAVAMMEQCLKCRNCTESGPFLPFWTVYCKFSFTMSLLGQTRLQCRSEVTRTL